ncbi:tRNA wybutosine-synthesizing protein [Lachnellula subtilissima]|uniref:tRNA wybutosine-synthesizing protein 4 n=1 Tax=Lachnellula subtilissima TaxID=602034 RepID=A0A8H8RV13_9HELO|nr:tRNA wybutosine-synthesizing protein [Lachnellula subtilissima]
MVTLKAVPSAPSQIQDDAIMGTNNSSIVSKRSVERLYFPDEPHFFRYFVKKPQRRSPLINRGYWLSDPLSWQCLSRYPALCNNVSFVDIDYKELMLKKRDMVNRTPELKEFFTNVELLEGDILLRSDQYLQIGCDLRDLDTLDKALASAFDFKEIEILFVAEVSITYMDAHYADNLIEWASKFQARFCLLEQLLPEGISHPFARSMMAHFQKLKTPLKAVEKYPTLSTQQQRFHARGWQHVSARNLWELWGSPDFLSSRDRMALDAVENFDEYEELALFGCHYVLLVADNIKSAAIEHLSRTEIKLGAPLSSIQMEIQYSESPKGCGYRRFAAGLPLKSNRTSVKIGNLGGAGSETRSDSCDIYADNLQVDPHTEAWKSQFCPSKRQCHTITDLGDTGSLLCGGRTSPDNALKDCWLYHKWVDQWERVDDLPLPLYRHQAVNVGHGVLISTGRVSSRAISSGYHLWSRLFGWMECNLHGDVPPPTFGATLLAFDTGMTLDTSTIKRGIVAGGMLADAVVQRGIWEWELDHDAQHPNLRFQRSLLFPDNSEHHQYLARFGANVVNYKNNTYVLGGVIQDKLLGVSDEICAIDAQGSFHIIPRTEDDQAPRPLLVGATIMATNNSILIMGGGATCFSFGTFWNGGCYTLSPSPSSDSSDAFGFVKTIAPQPQIIGIQTSVPTKHTSAKLTTVHRMRIMSPEDFDQILQTAVPVILEGLAIGSCTEKWTDEYLKETVGPEREVNSVIVHQSESSYLDFATKNFKYITMGFGKFVDSISNQGKLYLRSLSAQSPTDTPSDLSKDYPTLSADFNLPNELEYVTNNSHSAPLRIAGPVTMWLHYDVMANVLCQIRGQKRLVLFPPHDIMHLGFEPGASSSSINVFEHLQDPYLSFTHPYEAILEPGDILFIPSLWLHTAKPETGVSVAVNVFFRDLKTGYGVGRDVYGNRDLQPYEKGRQDIKKIIKAFDKLPKAVQNFYLQRLAAEFQQKSLNI